MVHMALQGKEDVSRGEIWQQVTSCQAGLRQMWLHNWNGVPGKDGAHVDMVWKECSQTLIIAFEVWLATGLPPPELWRHSNYLCRLDPFG